MRSPWRTCRRCPYSLCSDPVWKLSWMIQGMTMKDQVMSVAMFTQPKDMQKIPK